MRKITCLQVGLLFLLISTLTAIPLLTCGPVFANEQQCSASPQNPNAHETPDPYESLNRKVFKFNDRLYFWVMKPIAKAYLHLPSPVRKAVGNGFQNLEDPARFVNFVLQGRPHRAGDEMSRFIINSTVGVGGLFDVAHNAMGVDDHDADFGQTLGKWGMWPGAYLVIPGLGPSDGRDIFGYGVDQVMNPLFWVPGPFWYTLPADALKYTDKTAAHLGDYEALKKASLDPYVAMRNGYMQHRKNMVEGHNTP